MAFPISLFRQRAAITQQQLEHQSFSTYAVNPVSGTAPIYITNPNA